MDRLADNSEQKRNGQRHEVGRNINIVLTDEEKKILRQCQHDSLYKSALPLVVIGLGLNTALVRTGRVRGSLPRTLGITLLSYLAGKFLYIGECQRRILQQAPDGQLAAKIRTYQGLVYSDSERESMNESGQETSKQPLGDYSSSISFDKAPIAKGLDDRNLIISENAEERNKKVSYEELRQKNRKNFDAQVQAESQKYSPKVAELSQQQERRPPSYPDPVPQPKVRRNQYGDVIE